MSHLANIVSMVGGLNQRQQAVFALACAERVAPVFRRLALPESAKVFDDVLGTAWLSITSEKCVTNAARGLGLINGLPEATADDSLRPEYYAMRSLSVLAYALQALAGDDLPVAIKSACSAALDLCAGCEFIICGKGTRKIVYGQSPSLPEVLESVEMAAQNATLQALQNKTGLNESLCKNIRQMAKETSDQLAHVLPRFIQQQGWEIR